MGVVSINSGSQNATVGVEHSLAQVSGVGIYVLRVDTSVMAAGDTLEIRLKVPVKPGSEIRTTIVDTLTGAQSSPIWRTKPVMLASGEEIIATITQTAGTGRAFGWNLLRA